MNGQNPLDLQSLVVPLDEVAAASGVGWADIRRFGDLGLITPAQHGLGHELYFVADIPAVALLRLMELQGHPVAELREARVDIERVRLGFGAWGNRTAARLLAGPVGAEAPADTVPEAPEAVSLRRTLDRWSAEPTALRHGAPA